MTPGSPTTFDVVYYTGPVPSSWQTLATLALVFDKIHFPGVYMGTDGLDEEGHFSSSSAFAPAWQNECGWATSTW
jgi:hypothetical protein